MDLVLLKHKHRPVTQFPTNSGTERHSGPPLDRRGPRHSGPELLSPRYYEDFIVPYSKRFSQVAHDFGLLIYAHFCSPLEPFLTMGFYNEMGIDLFETLSSPPVGNIKSLKDALTKLDPHICTRGNLGLEVLLNSPPQRVFKESCRILEAAGTRKHILAASDYLFYDVPEENVRAMVDAVKAHVG